MQKRYSTYTLQHRFVILITVNSNASDISQSTLLPNFCRWFLPWLGTESVSSTEEDSITHKFLSRKIRRRHGQCNKWCILPFAPRTSLLDHNTKPIFTKERQQGRRLWLSVSPLEGISPQAFRGGLDGTCNDLEKFVIGAVKWHPCWPE